MSKQDLTDFYDSHHLRYCDESYLDRRILPYETALNMRDIGGYTNKEGEPLRWGKIYRGEELYYLDDKDQEKFNELGINYVIDFRDRWATTYKPDRLPENARYLHLPVLENLEFEHIDVRSDELNSELINNFMKGMYLAQAKNRAPEFAKVLKILRDDPDATLYIHCTNGKDRTGFMIALIMLVAGIEEEKVISEYSLTNHTFDKAYKELSKTMSNINNDSERDFYGVDPDWLQVQLDYINNNFGSVDNYLIQNSDLTKEDLNKIRHNILERK